MNHRHALAAFAALGLLASAQAFAREAGEAPRQEDRREDRREDRSGPAADDHGRHREGREGGANRSGRGGAEDSRGSNRGPDRG